jgi:hypothetical protein
MYDIETALAELEISFDVRNNEALALCPMHKARTGSSDNSPSWWINLETGAHMCFSCHYKGSILQLICDIKGFHTDTWGVHEYDYEAAKAWLANISEITPEKLAMALANIPRQHESYVKPLEMSEARLAVFVAPPQEQLDQRKITHEAAQDYEILWDEKKECWVLPLRNPQTGKLLGWQEKGTVTRSFFNRPTGLKKSSTLFGYPTLGDGDVVVVESPLDCARLRSAGVNNVVAICGSTISEDQFKLIRYADRVSLLLTIPR